MPHICFIALNIYPVLVHSSGLPFVGGAEVQQSVQMRALHSAGYKVSVLVKDTGQPEVVDCDGITLYKIPDSGKRGLPGTRFFYPRMSDTLRLLMKLSPDIVFIQTAGEQVASAALYAKLAGKRFVFAGASDPDFAKGPLPGMPRQHAFMYRLGLRAAHALIAQNTAQLAMIKAHYGWDGHLIGNGYAESNAQSGLFRGHLLWAATIKPQKHPERFIELARRLPDRQFIMVGGPGEAEGDAAFAETIAQAAAELPNLALAGHVPYAQVGRCFDGAAVVLNTSDYEGFPNTFLQAWLRGIPTVSFVQPESGPGLSGTLACKSLDDMAAHLQWLTHDEVAWRRASQACSQHFNAFHTIEKAVARYDAVFQQVLSA